MTYSIRYFSAARTIAGTSEDLLDPRPSDDPPTMREIWERLVARHPALDGLGQHLEFSVDRQRIDLDTRVPAGAEIAILSPVTGGAPEHEERSWAEPWKVKVVEPIEMTSRPERREALRAAGYNTFLLDSDDVYIDLLTDSGTSAMSQRQWAGLMLGDEAYAGSRNFANLEQAVREHYGYEHVVPTHQGRGAEHLLSQVAIDDGQIVPNNMYFTTTRFHQEYAGGVVEDGIVDEAHDLDSDAPFKGNVDLGKLEALVGEHGADSIAYVNVAATVNMAGGQPVSMQNIERVGEFTSAHGIPLYLDATRAVENAYFIQQREEGWSDASIREILREFCSHTDGCTMSAKKDSLVNIGGWVAVDDRERFDALRNLVVVFEGLHTYGGLAGRDLEAMARGIEESVDDDHVAARVGQVEYLGERLDALGIPIIEPIGGHAVFIDAEAFYPQIPREQFPAQTLAAELYLDSGARSMERGTVSAGRDPETGENRHPDLELVRLTLPRRVYTQAHMDVTAESVARVHRRRGEAVGLRFTFEPDHLRFFQARFERVE